MPAPFKERIFPAPLNTQHFGKHFYYFKEMASTNTHALALARKGVKEGTVVAAGYQTAGKGSHSRSWLAAPESNILMSLICYPNISIQSALKMTLLSAVILQNSISAFFKAQKIAFPTVSLKWPNDILIGNKKLAGILVESAIKGNRLEAVVVGIGINVNASVLSMEKSIQNKAVAIIDLIQKKTNIWSLAATVLEHYEKAYNTALKNNFKDLNKNWAKYSVHNTQPMHIKTPSGIEKGIFAGLNADGFLQYRDSENNLKTLISGQILY